MKEMMDFIQIIKLKTQKKLYLIMNGSINLDMMDQIPGMIGLILQKVKMEKS